MIRNIIFDIGNVLTDYRWEGFLADKGFDAEMIKKIAKASIMHPLWAEYDRGTWTDEQVLAAFVKDAPELEKELHQAFENIAGMVTPRAYAISWLQELKAKGYHVYYLSNFSHKAETECAEALNFLPEMEGGILSYKDQLIKPEPEIYQLLLKRYGLKADESVFLDDTLMNVKAAEEQGIHGIHFLTKEQAEEELRKLGVRLLPQPRPRQDRKDAGAHEAPRRQEPQGPVPRLLYQAGPAGLWRHPEGRPEHLLRGQAHRRRPHRVQPPD